MARRPTLSWKNASVLAFAGEEEPVAAIERKTRAVTFAAMDKGWAGPPFDPFQLAQILGITLAPSDAIKDARLITNEGNPTIEYNPNRNPARIRFSIAHEIAHTFFPDYPRVPRHRSAPAENTRADWELEILCNVAAAELLMPIGTLEDTTSAALSIDDIMRLREEYAVSTEAILIRYVTITNAPCCTFAASRTDWASNSFRVEYFTASVTWRGGALKKNQLIENSSILEECSAIGFTSKATEHWDGLSQRNRIECVGLPPFPGSSVPRVAGLIRPNHKVSVNEQVEHIVGDALKARGGGTRIIAHIVNNKASSWAPSGFAGGAKSRYPKAHKEYKDFVSANPGLRSLGNIHTAKVEDSLYLVSLIAQRGYGSMGVRRLQYSALSSCLEKLADVAQMKSATIHMPKIGTGLAGGDWAVIEQLIHTHLVARGVKIYIYELPKKI